MKILLAMGGSPPRASSSCSVMVDFIYWCVFISVERISCVDLLTVKMILDKIVDFSRKPPDSSPSVSWVLFFF